MNEDSAEEFFREVEENLEIKKLIIIVGFPVSGVFAIIIGVLILWHFKCRKGPPGSQNQLIYEDKAENANLNDPEEEEEKEEEKVQNTKIQEQEDSSSSDEDKEEKEEKEDN